MSDLVELKLIMEFTTSEINTVLTAFAHSPIIVAADAFYAFKAKADAAYAAALAAVKADETASAEQPSLPIEPAETATEAAPVAAAVE